MEIVCRKCCQRWSFFLYLYIFGFLCIGILFDTITGLLCDFTKTIFSVSLLRLIQWHLFFLVLQCSVSCLFWRPRSFFWDSSSQNYGVFVHLHFKCPAFRAIRQSRPYQCFVHMHLCLYGDVFGLLSKDTNYCAIFQRLTCVYCVVSFYMW